ncbi:hypothetical protein [Nostoc sp. ChiVER01]|uniref:hypothetical protein n=1 Tax=Nostoc sp. ChiVER01 TaxID=3075382 RepID=UPI002AD3771A|nr:hypothetical protein [Nostoc sp. ChiVER01]MDZ8225254.1 hypothetical protein [Nostoc sp. ChiVER01]
MSVYIPVELKKEIRNYFADCCAYCRTAEALIVSLQLNHVRKMWVIMGEHPPNI